MPYITPQSLPTDYIVRRLTIPNDVDLIAAVNGALLDLTQTWNWEQVPTGVAVSDVTPLMLDMWIQYLRSTGENMIGQIYPVITTTIPVNTLLCDGASYLRVDYPLLYAALDSAFITDADNFTVPDLRGRTIIGTGTGTAPDATAHTVNQMAGTETHTLTVAQLPSHNHSYTPPTLNVDLETPGAPDIFAAGVGLPTVTGNTGSDNAHNNMQPYTALKYVVIAR